MVNTRDGFCGLALRRWRSCRRQVLQSKTAGCPELCQAQKDKISEQSLTKSAKLKMKPYLFLCLKANGQARERYWETIFPSLGEPLTRNIEESCKDADASFLSLILEDKPPEKYYLSPKACAGILTRAERRGKALPEMLEKALERQAGLC